MSENLSAGVAGNPTREPSDHEVEAAARAMAKDEGFTEPEQHEPAFEETLVYYRDLARIALEAAARVGVEEIPALTGSEVERAAIALNETGIDYTFGKPTPWERLDSEVRTHYRAVAETMLRAARGLVVPSPPEPESETR